MNHYPHAYVREHSGAPAAAASLNRVALGATVHCLTGCAIGEVLGMVIGAALGLGNAETIALAIAGVAAYPVNRWLIARGRGHAVAHQRH